MESEKLESTAKLAPPTVAPFKLHTSPGVTDDGRLYVTIDWDGKRLSITGVIGPKSNGNARGSCGQTGIPPLLPQPQDEYTHAMVGQLRAIWDRWHLNDMRVGCEHQRAAWDHATLTAPLDLHPLTWGPRYNDAGHRAEAGKMSVQDYVQYAAIASTVLAVTVNPKRPMHPDLWNPEVVALIDADYLTLKPVEHKPACETYPQEHPGGLLMKPCPECGYRYGSAWLYEAVPVDVLEFLRGLPDNAAGMPACWRR